MPKNSLNVSLKGADDIFSTEESRQEQQREQVQQIPIGELVPFKNHPFKVLDDESMQRTVESVEQYGVLSPLIARPRPEGGYEIISGHRRQHAAQLAGLDALPVIVRQMDDDAAVLLMVDSNLQRENILPSERAFAYKMKLEALKNQGARSDLTCGQFGHKLIGAKARDIVADESGDNARNVQRFIRLTSLIPELLDMVDEKKIAFNPAVELSYLDESQQRDFLEAIYGFEHGPEVVTISAAEGIHYVPYDAAMQKKSPYWEGTYKACNIPFTDFQIHSEKDVLKLVTALMTNTKGEGQGGDPFWDKAERLLLVSLIAYLHYEAPVEEKNFATLLEMLNTMQVSEDDETYQNPVDLLFEDLGKKKPKSFAVRQYKLYKLAAGKTAKSILISCGARLAPFDIQEVRDATMYDELELDKLGDRKTALFLIMSDTDSTFNFLISMIYSQLFNLLCEKADDVYGGRLPVHVRCLIDECANIGQIPNLEKLMATIRSREISACLVLQAQSQLKALYKDNADTIIGNCDSSIFLGGKEPGTLKELNQVLGKETIDTFNTGESRGREVSHSLNYQKLGKDLATIDELAVLDGGKCILQLRGVRPFLSDKYDITRHPNYKYLSDANPRNAFDIEKYLSTRLVPKADEVYEVFDAGSV